MERWKDEAKSRGLSFSVFCRQALDAYCEDFGAIKDRVAVKSRATEEMLSERELRELPASSAPEILVQDPAGVDLFEPLSEPSSFVQAEPIIVGSERVDWWVASAPERDNTVARIFDRLESGEAPTSKPRKSRSQPCEHRVPPTAFCHWCD